MSAILKAGRAPVSRANPTVFHMRDLLGEVQQVRAEARAEAARTVADARQEGARLREEARQEGFREGLDQGQAEGRQRGADQAFAEARDRYESDLEHMAQSLASAMQQVSEQRLECLRAAERDVLGFVIEIAKRVTKSIGELNRNVAPENLRGALALVVGQTDISVRAHGDDLAALRRFASRQMDEMTDLPHICFVADESITRGGVQVVAGAGQIQATIEEQMDQIAKALVGGEQE